MLDPRAVSYSKGQAVRSKWAQCYTLSLSLLCQTGLCLCVSICLPLKQVRQFQPDLMLLSLSIKGFEFESLSISLPVCLSVCLPACLSVCLSLCLSLTLSLFPALLFFFFFHFLTALLVVSARQFDFPTENITDTLFQLEIKQS